MDVLSPITILASNDESNCSNRISDSSDKVCFGQEPSFSKWTRSALATFAGVHIVINANCPPLTESKFLDARIVNLRWSRDKRRIQAGKPP